MSNKVKRLNESERLEIISLLRQPNPASKRSIARQYEVSEAAIRKVWLNREDICKRSALMSEEAKKKKFRASVGKYTELEDQLYLWIDSMRRASLPVAPSLAMLKAKKSLNSFQYRRMTSKRHGSGSADLENVVGCNKISFTVKEQRWTEKVLVFWRLWISYMQ